MPSVSETASLYLHHLLNQSISGLDFCIVWQELVENCDELTEVNSLVVQFLEHADLSALDRALALLPPLSEDKLTDLPQSSKTVQAGWTVRSHRIRDVSRADFTCQRCGWSITLSQEHAPNTEMRLPFENFECPFCEPEEPSSSF